MSDLSVNNSVFQNAGFNTPKISAASDVPKLNNTETVNIAPLKKRHGYSFWKRS